MLRVAVGRVSTGPAQGIPLYLRPWPQAVLLPRAAARGTKVAAQSQGTPLSPHLCLLPLRAALQGPCPQALAAEPLFCMWRSRGSYGKCLIPVSGLHVSSELHGTLSQLESLVAPSPFVVPRPGPSSPISLRDGVVQKPMLQQEAGVQDCLPSCS